MKKWGVMLVLLLFAAPAAVLADPKIDFNTNCAKCHRTNANLPKQAKLLKVDPAKLVLRTSTMNRDEMIAIIEKGREKMPGFEKELTKEQITDIVDYILLFRKKR